MINNNTNSTQYLALEGWNVLVKSVQFFYLALFRYVYKYVQTRYSSRGQATNDKLVYDSSGTIRQVYDRDKVAVFSVDRQKWSISGSHKVIQSLN